MRGSAGVFWAALVAGLITAGAVRADHYIYSPVVEEGVLELETRLHRSVDSAADKNNAQTHIFELGYGVTSWWHTALVGVLDKQPQGSLSYNATGWENIFQLTQQGEYWLDAGLYLEYARGWRGQPDEFETKILLEKAVQPLVLTANLIFNKQAGQNADKGIGFEYGVRAKWPWTRGLQFGVEAFGESGRIGDFAAVSQQHHAVGPVLLGRFNVPHIPGVFGYQVGYLFGVTSASAKGEMKGVLEYEIPF